MELTEHGKRDDVDHPWKSKTGFFYLVLYISIGCIYSATLVMLYPLVSLRLLDLNTSQTEIGLVFACAPIGMVVSANFMGYLSAKIGRVYILLVGCLCLTIVNFIAGFLTELYQHYILLLLFGLSGASIRSSLLTVIDRHFGKYSELVMGVYEFAGGIGYTVGPLYGAAIYEVTQHFYVPYLTFGCPMFILTIAIAATAKKIHAEQKLTKLRFRRSLPRVDTGKHMFQTISSGVLTYPPICNGLLNMFGTTFAWTVVSVVLAKYLKAFDLSTTMIGFAFSSLSLGYTVGTPVVGRMMARGNDKLLSALFGNAACGVCFFLMSNVVLPYYGESRVPLVILWIGMCGVAISFAYVTLGPMLMEICARPDLGFQKKTDFISGMYTVANAVGTGIGAVSGAALADFYDFGTSMLYAAVVLWVITLPGFLYKLPCFPRRRHSTISEIQVPDIPEFDEDPGDEKQKQATPDLVCV